MFCKIKKLFIDNKVLVLVLSFFVFYLFISLNYNLSVPINYNYLFESDSPRVIGDISEIFYNHYRSSVHPLFVVIFQPIILFINGIIHNKLLSIIVFSSVIGALQVFVMYKTIMLFKKKNMFSMIVSILFGLSCSNLVFNAGIELYNIACLCLQLLWYFVFKIIVNKEDIDRNNFLILLVVGVLNFAVTITNFIVFVIALLCLFIYKKNDKGYCLKLFCLFGSIILFCLLFNIIQKIIYGDYISLFLINSEKSYVNFNVNFNSFVNVILNFFVYNLIGGNLGTIISSESNMVLQFNFQFNFKVILVLGLYIYLLFMFVKNFKKNKIFNVGLLLVIIFNFLLHLVYGNNNVFLYSEHVNYLIFLIIGLNCDYFIKYKKLFITFGCLFILFVLINNLDIYFKILDYGVIIFDGKVVDFKVLFIICIIFLSVILMALFLIKHVCKFDRVFSVLVVICYVYFVSLVFIFVKVNVLDDNDFVYSSFKEFYANYSEEMVSYTNYVNEYVNFSLEHDIELIDINGGYDYYFFGLGNRRKLVYFDGKLKDLFSDEVLFEWNVVDYVIIPNIYTVLLKLDNGSFIKIYENNEGVFVCDGIDYVVDGTLEKIDLFDFSSYKYNDLLSGLYGEILFNINDNKIYPNVIVYDEVWYRDASISAMVLKYTNNIDLIKPWIESIDKIYDNQNAGNSEPDNLGQVLYLLSLIEDERIDLIDRIETETNYIKDKYNLDYLYGVTDGDYLSYYQNVWYNFGLSSLGRDKLNNINKISLDKYSSTTWWAGKCDNGKLYNSNYFYPYLGWAQYHCIGYGDVYLNKGIYPLSYEINASEADYDAMDVVDSYFAKNYISPVHSWSASEIFMYLIDFKS